MIQVSLVQHQNTQLAEQLCGNKVTKPFQVTQAQKQTQQQADANLLKFT